MLRGHRKRRGWWMDTEMVLVDDSCMVTHACGHTVFYELLPGRPNDDIKDWAQWNCICCGGGWGDPEEWSRRNGHPCPEWPDHSLLAGIGMAHLHSPDVACENIDARHRAGLAHPAGNDA